MELNGLIVGFTGTRAGISEAQRAMLKRLLPGAVELHHGDCVGADEEVHALALGLKIPIVIHPPSDNKLRAFCKNARMMEPRPYLTRNRAIVNVAQIVVATPRTDHEPLPGRGQGTWSTVRFARRMGREVIVLYP